MNTNAPAKLPLTLSEHDFQTTVMEYAKLRRWLCVHIRAAMTNKGWRTPIEGDPGLPDLILARGGVVILAELKAHTGRATPWQVAWLKASGGYLWSPKDWPTVMEVLR